MKRISSLLLSLMLLFSLAGCAEDTAIGIIGGADGPTSILVTGPDESNVIGEADGPTSILVSTPCAPEEIGVIGGETFTIYLGAPEEDGYYYDLENVVLYLECYGRLPDNYITKSEARELGWEGGTPERYLEGAAIGGDRFGNREGLLPDGNYTECDLNTDGADSRGAERLVFSDEGDYYYTEDHYASFTEVWVENGEVIWE